MPVRPDHQGRGCTLMPCVSAPSSWTTRNKTAAGILTPGSARAVRLPDILLVSGVLLDDVLPGHSGGTVPVSHRLPCTAGLRHEHIVGRPTKSTPARRAPESAALKDHGNRTVSGRRTGPGPGIWRGGRRNGRWSAPPGRRRGRAAAAGPHDDCSELVVRRRRGLNQPRQGLAEVDVDDPASAAEDVTMAERRERHGDSARRARRGSPSAR